MHLGHAGIIFIDSNGHTEYYEYGRYPSGMGKVLPQGQGNYRRVTIPDMKNMTEQEFTDMLGDIFKDEDVIETVWRDTDDYSKGYDYIMNDANDQ